MKGSASRRFSRGFVDGLIVASLIVVTATGVTGGFGADEDWSGMFGTYRDWIGRNLGSSVVVFAAVLFLYFHSLHRLQRLLAVRATLQQIAQAEQLVDLWTNLFFGIGVVWTAVGMRAALVAALGDPQEAAHDGAFAILARLVDGGILTALSTTIVGGVGGYSMRVLKTLLLGSDLKQLYVDLGDQRTADVTERLRSLDAKAQTLVQFVHRREKQLDATAPVEPR